MCRTIQINGKQHYLWRAVDQDGEVVDVKSVYEEDGNRFVSASSIAVQHNGKLLIGTINNRAVMCDIKNK